MNVYIMTDMEAVAGVLNSLDWCYPNGRYYDLGRELLTQETNAAIEGFLAAGAKRITVCDGHGWGGINPRLLHPRAELLAGSFRYIRYPFGLTAEDDVMAWVGQHAMAGTPFGHLAHTGSFEVLECTLNGQPVGEMGQMAYVGAELGVRSIFLSGDLAGCAEAAGLVPGIETVSVKEGLYASSGTDLTGEEAERAFTAARHLSPQAAFERIREGAERSLWRARVDETLGQLERLVPPFSMKSTQRRTPDGKSGITVVRSHPTSVIEALNAAPVET